MLLIVKNELCWLLKLKRATEPVKINWDCIRHYLIESKGIDQMLDNTH